MEAIQSSTEDFVTQEVKEVSAVSSILRFNEEEMEFNRFGIISVGILLIGTIGGLTVGFSALQHLWQIAVIAVFTMVSFSLMLAVAPMKWIIRTTALALGIDFLIIILNLIL